MSAQRNEECRQDVLAWLAARPSLKFRADFIHTSLKRKGHDYTANEVLWAGEFLSDFPVALQEGGKEYALVEWAFETPFSSMKCFGITPHGQLYAERNS